MHYDPPRQHQNPYIYVLVYIMCDVSGIYFPLGVPAPHIVYIALFLLIEERGLYYCDSFSGFLISSPIEKIDVPQDYL